MYTFCNLHWHLYFLNLLSIEISYLSYNQSLPLSHCRLSWAFFCFPRVCQVLAKTSQALEDFQTLFPSHSTICWKRTENSLKNSRYNINYKRRVVKVGTERQQGYPGGYTRLLGQVMGFLVWERSVHFEQSPTNLHWDK